MGRGVELSALRPTPAQPQPIGSKDFPMPQKTPPAAAAETAGGAPNFCSNSAGGQ